MNVKIAICDDEKEFAGTLLNNIRCEFKNMKQPVRYVLAQTVMT